MDDILDIFQWCIGMNTYELKQKKTIKKEETTKSRRENIGSY